MEALARGEAVIPRRWRILPPDRRSRGSMAQFVREFLTDNPKGWSRLDLRAAVQERPEFESISGGRPDAFYNLIGRLRNSGEIEDRNGLLFASDSVRNRILRARSLCSSPGRGDRCSPVPPQARGW